MAPLIQDETPNVRSDVSRSIPQVLEVLVLSGEIDLHVSSKIGRIFSRLTAPNVLLDCRAVSYIDSSGLAVLIEVMQETEARGGRLGLLGLGDAVRPIFEIARLDKVFSMVEDTPEAVRLFLKISQDQVDTLAAHHVSELNAGLMAHFARHPELLYTESPKRFELVVMELLRDMGCEVQYVGGSKDHGRDILATLNVPFGTLLIIVQCKRYSAATPIPPDMVRSLMFVVNDQDKASYGLLATTSRFGPGAIAIQQQYRHRLGLADFDRLKDWLSHYGKWKGHGTARLWVPSVFETPLG
jgi:anti-sigma B factor antagonist